MKLKDQKDAMDAIVRELFRNGGPMRPANGGSRISIEQVATSPAGWRKPDPCLMREQKRLIKTWKGQKR